MDKALRPRGRGRERTATHPPPAGGCISCVVARRNAHDAEVNVSSKHISGHALQQPAKTVRAGPALGEKVGNDITVNANVQSQTRATAPFSQSSTNCRPGSPQLEEVDVPGRSSPRPLEAINSSGQLTMPGGGNGVVENVPPIESIGDVPKPPLFWLDPLGDGGPPNGLGVSGAGKGDALELKLPPPLLLPVTTSGANALAQPVSIELFCERGRDGGLRHSDVAAVGINSPPRCTATPCVRADNDCVIFCPEIGPKQREEQGKGEKFLSKGLRHRSHDSTFGPPFLDKPVQDVDVAPRRPPVLECMGEAP